MKPRDDFDTDKDYASWVYQHVYRYGVGWLAEYCAKWEIPVTEEALDEELYEATPVGQFEQNYESYWAITVGDVSVPITLTALIDGVKADNGDQGKPIIEIVTAFKANVKSKVADALANDAAKDTPEQTQEHATYGLESGVFDLVFWMWQDIGEMPADSDFCGVWIYTDHGGLWVWFTPEEAEAMCRTAYPDVFQLIDGAITSTGGAA